MRLDRSRGGAARRRAPILVVALLALLLGGCGDDDEDLSTAGDAPIAHPDGNRLVLQVEHTGGLRPAGSAFSDVPSVTVLGDGTMIAEGAQIEIHPPPILPPLFELELTEQGVQELLEAAEDAGLLAPPADYGRPPIADAATTTIRVHADGDELSHEIYALGQSAPDTPGVTETQADLRQTVSGFVDRLPTPQDGLISPSEVGAEVPYEPDRFAIRARPTPSEGSDAEASSEVLDWPLANVALADAGDCVVVSGDRTDRLSGVLADADTATRFRQDGVVHELRVRPLLPHEEDCADIGP